jgi:hypothetical protein
MRMQSACHVQLRVSSCSLQGRHADAGTTGVPKTNSNHINGPDELERDVWRVISPPEAAFDSH